MTTNPLPSPPQCVIGVDVGGTKTAAGALLLPAGEILARRLQPSAPERGGAQLLEDVIAMIRDLQVEAVQGGYRPLAVGIGIAELVDRSGRLVSDATIRWRELPIDQTIQAATVLPARLEADVRAAALAEARLGAGRGSDCFLYVTIGTGISSALVLNGSPYLGARGLTGTFASNPTVSPAQDGTLVAAAPLEQFSSGPAIATRFAAARPGFGGTAADVLSLAENGDVLAAQIIGSAGRALGSALGSLVNVLDPELLVLGGGLGLAGGLYREAIQEEMIRTIWADDQRSLPAVSATLGRDAGWIGAALAALDRTDPTPS
jgi:glucokinase